MRLALILLLLCCQGVSALPLDPYPPPPTLMVLGDSIVVGLHASEKPRRFAELAAQRLGMELKDFAASGRNLPGIEQQWRDYMASGNVIAPQIIVIAVGINDASGFGGNAYPEAEWPQRYREFIAQLRADMPNSRIILATPFAMRLPASESQVLFRYVTMVRQIAIAEGLPLADFYAVTRFCACTSRSSDPSAFSPFTGDGIHPNDLGHALMAEILVAAINRKLVFFAVGAVKDLFCSILHKAAILSKNN
jgi:lysophospholipase L1-like esterase